MENNRRRNRNNAQNAQHDQNSANEQNAPNEQNTEIANGNGQSDYFMDIDRMVNDGLAGGNVSMQNGLIEEATTDTMAQQDNSEPNEDTEKNVTQMRPMTGYSVELGNGNRPPEGRGGVHRR